MVRFYAIFLLFANVFLIQCGQKEPSSDYYTCQQQTANTLSDSSIGCEQLDVNNTGACNIAAPVLEPLVFEPCNSTIIPGNRKRRNINANCKSCSNRCLWRYKSQILNQKVCVGQRLVNGLHNGDVQYKLGVKLLTQCNVNGYQKCVGDYGYITCKNGIWTVSHVCNNNEVCRESLQIGGSFGNKIIDSMCCGTKKAFIQKAQCVQLN